MSRSIATTSLDTAHVDGTAASHACDATAVARPLGVMQETGLTPDQAADRLAQCSLLLLIAVYVPALASVLSVVPPTPHGWTVIRTLSLVPFAVGKIGHKL